MPVMLASLFFVLIGTLLPQDLCMYRARFLGYIAQFIDWYKHHHFGVQRFLTLSYMEVSFSSSCSTTTMSDVVFVSVPSTLPGL